MTASRLPSRAATVVVLAHDSASGPDAVRRALGRACLAADLELVVWDHGTNGVEHVADELGRLAVSTGARVVGGLGTGACAAVHWAAGRELDGLLLALPPRSDRDWPAPGTLARVTAATGIATYADAREGGAADAWAAELAIARVQRVDAAELVTDPATLGDAVVRAWLWARNESRAAAVAGGGPSGPGPGPGPGEPWLSEPR